MADADCIVVGLRCAGAPLALALHRAGIKVIAVERDELYTDQPFSTHAIAPYGMRMLDQLGLGDAVRALAPRAPAIRMQVEDAYLQVDLSDDASTHACRCNPGVPIPVGSQPKGVAIACASRDDLAELLTVLK